MNSEIDFFNKIASNNTGFREIDIIYPEDNRYTPYCKLKPYMIIDVNYSGYDCGRSDDPDMEFLLFEELDDALALTKYVIKEEKESWAAESNFDSALTYAIFKVKEGFLLTWADDQLEYGGNIHHYLGESDEKQELINKAIGSHSGCHAGENVFGIYAKPGECVLESRGYLDGEALELWKSVIGQLNE